MKWVLRTRRVIECDANGELVIRSMQQCPPEVIGRLQDTMFGPNSCKIVITNREAMEAIRNNTLSTPDWRAQEEARESRPADRGGCERLHLPSWQVLAGSLLATVATLTALLVWAIHSG